MARKYGSMAAVSTVMTPLTNTAGDASRRRRVARRRLGSLLVVAVLATILLLRSAGPAHSSNYRFQAEAHPQTQWAPCSRNALTGGASTFAPLSDRAAASLVTVEPETRPDNGKAYSINGVRYPATNSYVPSKALLAKFRAARTSLGQPVLQLDPYLRYVDGRDGLRRPSTDELIQWAAHKWGIPENWLRAEYVLESYWNSFMRGDLTSVTPSEYSRYPRQSRVPGAQRAYQSLGITQVRWDPKADYGAGTEPLRWLSTAFNVDFQAATVRFMYDNPYDARKAWGDASYRPCQQWNSIGAWYHPYPWANAGQAQYVKSVQRNLKTTVWRSSAFLGFSVPIPGDVKLK